MIIVERNRQITVVLVVVVDSRSEVVAVVGIVLGSQHLYLILSFFTSYEETESGCSLSLW